MAHMALRPRQRSQRLPSFRSPSSPRSSEALTKTKPPGFSSPVTTGVIVPLVRSRVPTKGPLFAEI